MIFYWVETFYITEVACLGKLVGVSFVYPVQNLLAQMSLRKINLPLVLPQQKEKREACITAHSHYLMM